MIRSFLIKMLIWKFEAQEIMIAGWNQLWESYVFVAEIQFSSRLDWTAWYKISTLWSKRKFWIRGRFQHNPLEAWLTSYSMSMSSFWPHKQISFIGYKRVAIKNGFKGRVGDRIRRKGKVDIVAPFVENNNTIYKSLCCILHLKNKIFMLKIEICAVHWWWVE